LKKKKRKKKDTTLFFHTALFEKGQGEWSVPISLQVRGGEKGSKAVRSSWKTRGRKGLGTTMSTANTEEKKKKKKRKREDHRTPSGLNQ